MTTKNIDFFSNINRHWMKTHKIPKRENRISVYSILEKQIKKQIDGIIKKDADLNRVVAIFEKDYNVKVLERVRRLIEELKDHQTLEQLMVWTFHNNIQFPLKFGIGDDPKDPKTICFIVGEPISLTLPFLALYKNDTAKRHLLSFVKDIFKIASINIDSIHDAYPQDVLDIEIILSESMYKTKHVPIEQLCNKYPLTNQVRSFFYLFGIKNYKSNFYIVENPKYFQAISKVLKTKQFKTYMLYQIVISYSKFHSRLQQCTFNFFSKYLNGIKTNENHHHRGENLVVSSIGNIQVSKLYLKTFKNNAEIKLCNTIVELIKEYMIKRISKNQYLHTKTIECAILKIQKIRFLISNSNSFKTEFTIPTTNDPFEILEHYNKYKQEQIISALRRGKRFNILDVWDDAKCGNVYDVNAYYIPTENVIVIPNGYLQPPFVDVRKSFAYNLGILGTTIGHEMFHAIDDEGCKFDQHGNLHMWWKKEDFKRYQAHQKSVINYYEKYAKREDHKQINGALTLGENISDIGGFLLAEDVLVASVDSRDFKQFYIAYAKQWRMNLTKQEEKKKLATDVHAPFKYRTNLVLSYSSIFHKIFFSRAKTKTFFW